MGFTSFLKRAHLGGVDELISEALSDGLDVPERSLSRSCAQQPDRLRQKTSGLEPYLGLTAWSKTLAG